MLVKKLLLPFLLLACVAVQGQVKEKKIRKYAKTITAKDLEAKLSIIAGAEMEGRETATPGQKKAAAYIESRFRKLGLLPGNGNSYQQMYPLFQDSITNYSLTVNGDSLVAGDNYLPSVTASAGAWKIDNVFFVGSGTLDTTLDVKDKWIFTEEDVSLQRLRGKLTYFRRKGVKGVILVSRFIPNATGRVQRKGNMYRSTSNSEFPYLSVSYAAISKALNKTLDSAALSKLAKTNYPVNITYSLSKQRLNLESSNVLGVLPGTDKKDEYVFITGHYDHLGKRGDSVIYYGADDDGSGTTSVIEIAEAFAKAKKKGHGPRRTMVFMTVSGEEKGLLGSEYYSEHPLFPLEKTSVDLNIDMVGRIDPKFKGDSLNYVFVIGEDKLSSDLMPITDSVNKKYIHMELDRKYNDMTDPNRYYFRSDHYNFAKKGVPIIFYFNGTHADYHRPTDTVDKINFELMEKRVRLVFYTAWEMANRDSMLKRDIPLNIPSRTQM